MELGRCIQIIIRSEHVANVLQGALGENAGARNVLTAG